MNTRGHSIDAEKPTMEDNLGIKGRDGHVYGIDRPSSRNTAGKSRSDEKVGKFLDTVSEYSMFESDDTDLSSSEDFLKEGFGRVRGISR